jgi:tetratricopeptide (TPR) repeat protein
MASRYEEAVEVIDKALELAPQSAGMRAWLALALFLQGRATDALERAGQEPEEWGRLFASAVIEHAAGRTDAADDALRQLVDKHSRDAAYQIAEVHASRGDADAAFEWLERARRQHDAGVAWTKVDPLLRNLHADARWVAFLRSLRFAG